MKSVLECLPKLVLSLQAATVLLALHAVPVIAAIETDIYAVQRAEFQRLYSATITTSTLPGEESAALKAYPLYPYLEAARLGRAVLIQEGDARTTDSAVEDFLRAHGNEPVTRDLRREWLSSLADRQEWLSFLENYREDTGDVGLQCQALNARIALNRASKLEPAVISVWLTGKDTPAPCEPAFAWLRAQTKLTPDLIEQRARLALTAGNVKLAKELTSNLPEQRAQPLKQWTALIEQPQIAFDGLIGNPDRAVEPAALLDGWTRLARQNPDAALARYDGLVQARHLSGADADPYKLALALSLAWNRRTESLRYFASLSAPSSDERAYEWHARSALWSQDWAQVADVIASMPATLKKQSRWRYWAARAADEMNRSEEAHAAYRELTGEDNYYAAMAAARLGERYAPHPQTLNFDDAQVQKLAAQPAMIRAHELLLCNLRPLATTEWLYGYGLLTPELQSHTVALASRWGWYEQAIATAARQSAFNDYSLLYPRPFDREAAAAAHQSKLTTELIYAVLRQESLYRPDAVSGAGAYGLLQLRPETAKRNARLLGKPLKDRTLLFEPAVNITLGAAELRSLLDRFDGQIPVALAAYNAGPAAASRWLPNAPVEPDVWIENIPYNETRAYVQRVLWHELVFTWLEHREARKNLAWLAPIKRANTG